MGTGKVPVDEIKGTGDIRGLERSRGQVRSQGQARTRQVRSKGIGEGQGVR